MIRDGKIVHPASDGSFHKGYFAALWRTIRHKNFLATYDGDQKAFGMRWNSVKGEGYDVFERVKDHG